MLNVFLFVLLTAFTSVTDCIYINKAVKRPLQYLTYYVLAKDVKDVKTLNTRPLARAGVRVLSYDGPDMAVGSGTLIGGEYVLTAKHVVEGRKAVIVQFENGFPVPAFLAFKLKNLDIAVLRVHGLNAQRLRLNRPQVGDVGILFGHPGFTERETTRIIVSQVLLHPSQDMTIEEYIVFSCNGVRPGYSGAAVFNQDGDIIGVMSFYYPSLGICFAVSSNEIVTTLN